MFVSPCARVHSQEALLTVLSHLELDDEYDGGYGGYGSYGGYDSAAYGAAAYGSFPHGVADSSNTVPPGSTAEAAGAGGSGAAGGAKGPAGRSVHMLEGNWREWWVAYYAGLVGYSPYGV